MTRRTVFSSQWRIHGVEKWIATPRDPKKRSGEEEEGKEEDQLKEKKKGKNKRAERSFSTLRRLKSWMWTRKSEEGMTIACPSWISIVKYLWAYKVIDRFAKSKNLSLHFVLNSATVDCKISVFYCVNAAVSWGCPCLSLFKVLWFREICCIEYCRCPTCPSYKHEGETLNIQSRIVSVKSWPNTSSF